MICVEINSTYLITFSHGFSALHDGSGVAESGFKNQGGWFIRTPLVVEFDGSFLKALSLIFGSSFLGYSQISEFSG